MVRDFEKSFEHIGLNNEAHIQRFPLSQSLLEMWNPVPVLLHSVVS